MKRTRSHITKRVKGCDGLIYKEGELLCRTKYWIAVHGYYGGTRTFAGGALVARPDDFFVQYWALRVQPLENCALPADVRLKLELTEKPQGEFSKSWEFYAEPESSGTANAYDYKKVVNGWMQD